MKDIADDLGVTFKGHFRNYKRFRCLCLKNAAYVMYEIDYNGGTSHVSNYFYYRIPPQWLSYDAERDLLAIAKFFVST